MAIESSRSRQLRKLSESLPGADQRTMGGLKAARETQLQEQIAQAPRTAGPQAAQQLGAQQAQIAGQQALAVGQQAQKQQAQIGQMGEQQAGIEAEARLGTQTRGLSKRERELTNRLSELSQDAKDQLLDQQLNFTRDQAGQALLNERQVADWAAANARSEEEFKDYAQSAMQMHERKIQMLQTASNQLQATLKRGYIIEGKRLGNEQKMQIAKEKEALDKKIRQEEIDRKNKAAMWGAAGSMVGAVAGGVFGGPGGAKAGAAAGGGAGSGASYL